MKYLPRTGVRKRSADEPARGRERYLKDRGEGEAKAEYKEAVMILARGTLELKSRFTREDLRELLAAEDGWRLSLFMPLARSGRDVRQAPILLKDLRARAAQALAARNAPQEAREEILAAVDQVLHGTETSIIQGEGLAIFSSAHFAASYLVPITPDASVTVDRRFRLDPILPLLFQDNRFYLLTLGVKSVALYEGDRGALREVSLEGVPTSLQEALQLDDDHLPFGALSSPGTRNKGGFQTNGAIYHGHGGARQDSKDPKLDILRFFQVLDPRLRSRMPDTSRPLLLAGVDSLLPVFRAACTHPRILDAALPAHLEKLSAWNELHAQAWALFERESKAERDAILARFRERLATRETASGITDVVPMADQGRVSHLFIHRGYQARGAYEPDTGKVFLSPPRQEGEEDLVDLVALAAVQTMMGNGKVYILEAAEMPAGSDIAALCRY